MGRITAQDLTNSLLANRFSLCFQLVDGRLNLSDELLLPPGGRSTPLAPIVLVDLWGQDGVEELTERGFLPGGLKNNRKFYEARVAIRSDIQESLRWLLFDPQTSGGLLMSLPPDQAEDALMKLHGLGIMTASIIGEIRSQEDQSLIEVI